jgi:hypothetical protein
LTNDGSVFSGNAGEGQLFAFTVIGGSPRLDIPAIPNVVGQWVIARKVSHCSKNEKGARVYEAMKSVTATLALRGHSVSRALADLIQGMPMPTALITSTITPPHNFLPIQPGWISFHRPCGTIVPQFL